MNPNFAQWIPALDRRGRTNQATPLGEFRSQTKRLIAEQRANGLSPTQRSQLAGRFTDEGRWHELGRPFFKLWPAVAEAFADTEVTLTGREFVAPFDTFVSMMPSDFSPAATTFVSIVPEAFEPTDEQLSQVRDMAGMASGAEREHLVKTLAMLRQHKASMAASKEKYGPVVAVIRALWPVTAKGFASLNCTLHERQSLEAAIDSTAFAGGVQDSPFIPLVDCRRAIRAAVIATMLAADRGDLFEEIIDLEAIHRRWPPGRSKATREIAEQKIAEAKAKCVQWNVGREIELPRRPAGEGADGGQGGGGAMTHSFWRRGHLKAVPYGPRGSLRKTVWIAPTLVREDLPPAPHCGFKILDRAIKRNPVENAG